MKKKKLLIVIIIIIIVGILYVIKNFDSIMFTLTSIDYAI